MRAGRHCLQYDDGDIEQLELGQEAVDWRPAAARSTPQPQGASPSEAAGPSTPGPPSLGADGKPTKDVPETVAVVCNDKRGMFDVKGMCIIMDGGRTVSATEFERLAGKAASKKWKSSIRVDKVGPLKPRRPGLREGSRESAFIQRTREGGIDRPTDRQTQIETKKETHRETYGRLLICVRYQGSGRIPCSACLSCEGILVVPACLWSETAAVYI